MRKLLFLIVLVAAAAAAEGQSCAECYWPPDGDAYCGLTTYNGAESCAPIDGQNGCTLVGSCAGADGEGPRIKYKWTCAPRLPEKAEWVVASVKIAQPEAPATPRAKS